MYKSECEKWRAEISNLNRIIGTYRNSTSEVKTGITQLLKEKDDQIQHLTNAIRHLQVSPRIL